LQHLKLAIVPWTVVLWAVASPSFAAPTLSPQAVVEAKFAAVNRHAVADVVALYAPDARVTAADFCQPRTGRAEVERTYRAIFAAAPDVRVELTDVVAQGSRVAVRFVLHAGAFQLPIMDFFTVEDGLITRDDGLFDNRGRACTP
jgi:hypothetical protein